MTGGSSTAPGPEATDGEAANPGPSAPSKGCRKKASRPKMMPGSASVPCLEARATRAHAEQGLEQQASASPRIHDLKRGVGAWANARNPQQDLVAASERLLVHSVSDTTALSSYLPAARKFLEWAERQTRGAPPVETWEDMDSLLVQYQGVQCYILDKHPQQGGLVMNAIAYLFPEASRNLPRGWRAARAFEKAVVVGQGKPAAEELLACMEENLRARSTPSARIAADAIPVAVDAYLREQDLFGLQCSDVTFDMERRLAALNLGVAARGESSKTGREQGVLVEASYPFEILLRRCQGCEADERVFPISAELYRKWWHSASRALSCEHLAGPPHTARHTGASRDLAEHRRSFSQVKRRGRWKTDEAIQRYARPHVWPGVRAQVPPDIMARGKKLMSQREAGVHSLH